MAVQVTTCRCGGILWRPHYLEAAQRVKAVPRAYDEIRDKVRAYRLCTFQAGCSTNIRNLFAGQWKSWTLRCKTSWRSNGWILIRATNYNAFRFPASVELCVCFGSSLWRSRRRPGLAYVGRNRTDALPEESQPYTSTLRQFPCPNLCKYIAWKMFLF